MSKKLVFEKMEGLGNDFIVLEEKLSPKITPRLAQILCDRRHGIGADQLMVLSAAKKPNHAKLKIWNSDGSIAEMCGNGIRAVALFLKRGTKTLKAPKNKNEYRIESDAGLKVVKIKRDSKAGVEVRVDMGAPEVGSVETLEVSHPSLGKRKFEWISMGMGNPHAVIYISKDEGAELAKTWGPLIECHPRFPKRTNVEFVLVGGSSKIKVNVWERGAGITLACGTGACAAAAASIATSRSKTPVIVELPGGFLQIEWSGSALDPVLMTGPARSCFKGMIDLTDPYWKAD